MHLGNSHRWRRRIDDLRYLPGDLRRWARSFRERLLANWAGYSLGQRVSTSALAVAVIVALGIVVGGGGGLGDGTDLAVVTDRGDQAERVASTTTPNRRPAESVAPTVVDTEPPRPPGSGIELSMVDNSALVDQTPADVDVLGATTVPLAAAGNRSVTVGNPLASMFPPTVSVPPPVTAPAVTTPPATTPPVTSPPVTAPPVTAPAVTSPPVTSPPVTAPPVTAPPTTAAPVTTAPPVTLPPTTAVPNP